MYIRRVNRSFAKNDHMKFKQISMAVTALVVLFSCGQKPQYANRAERLLAELKDPASEYVFVMAHRADWRNWPENSLEAIESANVSIALDPVNTSVLSETGRETITEKKDDATGEHNAATYEPVTVLDVPQKKPTADANAGQKNTDKKPGEKPQKSGSTARPITTDDITKIIVRKIKQNKANNERIGLVLKTYGVERVSDLKPEQYEAFITDLAAL